LKQRNHINVVSVKRQSRKEKMLDLVEKENIGIQNVREFLLMEDIYVVINHGNL
jgi:hypothetical protein